MVKYTELILIDIMLRILNPYFFNTVANKYIPWLCISMALLFTIGLYYSLFVSPADYQQGEMVRIMYVHVPAAWLSLLIYTFIAFCSLSSIVWKTKMSYILAINAAPIGMCFSLITLITGSLWGKPIWGAWWVWDARLTSMLILFMLYLSYIIVVNTGDDVFKAEKPAAVIALIGFINVPIIKFSVDIWYSLHQPSSFLKFGPPSIHKSMLIPLLLMFIAFINYFIVILLLRTRSFCQKYRNL